jgi:hypothetical protein
MTGAGAASDQSAAAGGRQEKGLGRYDVPVFRFGRHDGPNVGLTSLIEAAASEAQPRI